MDLVFTSCLHLELWITARCTVILEMCKLAREVCKLAPRNIIALVLTHMRILPYAYGTAHMNIPAHMHTRLPHTHMGHQYAVWVRC